MNVKQLALPVAALGGIIASGAANATDPTVAALASAVSFSDLLTGLSSIAGLVIAVAVFVKGVRYVLRMVGGGR